MDLSATGQELYDLLNDDKSVLARYIQAFDQNQDDDSALRSIGERIGIYIPDGEYSPVYLFEKLKEYILSKQDEERTREVINMTADDYEKYLEEKGLADLPRDQFYPLYANRLMEFLNRK